MTTKEAFSLGTAENIFNHEQKWAKICKAIKSAKNIEDMTQEEAFDLGAMIGEFEASKYWVEIIQPFVKKIYEQHNHNYR